MALVCGRTRFSGRLGLRLQLQPSFILSACLLFACGSDTLCETLGHHFFYDLCRGRSVSTSSSLLADVEAGSGGGGWSFELSKGEAYRVLLKMAGKVSMCRLMVMETVSLPFGGRADILRRSACTFRCFLVRTMTFKQSLIKQHVPYGL